MGSLDIDSLFTKMLLEKTIANCTNNLFKNSKIFYGFKKKKKKKFTDLLSLATKESNQILYLIIRYANKLTEEL